MTTKEFLIKKNELVKRATGAILIPSDQIVDEPKVKLDENCCHSLNSSNCPYCVGRRPYELSPIVCDTCPMYQAGNCCDNFNSTWYVVQQLWREKATLEDAKELKRLVQKYNK